MSEQNKWQTAPCCCLISKELLIGGGSNTRPRTSRQLPEFKWCWEFISTLFFCFKRWWPRLPYEWRMWKMLDKNPQSPCSLHVGPQILLSTFHVFFFGIGLWTATSVCELEVREPFLITVLFIVCAPRNFKIYFIYSDLGKYLLAHNVCPSCLPQKWRHAIS